MAWQDLGVFERLAVCKARVRSSPWVYTQVLLKPGVLRRRGSKKNSWFLHNMSLDARKLLSLVL